MMKNPLFLPLFFLSLIIGIKAIPIQESFSSKSNNTTSTDSLQITTLKNTIQTYVKNAEYDSVINYSKKLLQLSKKLSDSSLMATSNFYLGYYLQVQFKSDEAFTYYNEAFKIDIRLEDYEAAADMLNAMANIQKGLGDYIGSQITAVEGLKYLEGITNYRTESALYHIISVCFKELGDNKDALLWNDKAIQMAHEHPEDISKSTLVIFQTTRANILVKYEKYQEAITLYATLLEAVDQNNEKEKARILDNLAFTYWLSGERNSNNEDDFLKALELRLKINDLSGLTSSYIHLTQYYLEFDKVKSLEYAEKAYHITMTKNNPISTLEALDYIIRLKNELGKNATSEALAYSQIRNGLEKSNQMIRRIYATTKYDNDQLSKDVLLLKTTTAEKEKQNILYLSSFIVVLMGFSLLFIILKRRHRLEKIRESYKTETRISKKVHDELANDVYQLMIQLEASKNNHDLLDSMEKIYLRTRDISKENNGVHTDHRYSEELTTMLGGYTPSHAKIYIQDLDDIPWQKIDKEKKIALYRVLQELMTNMKKHSEASLVALTFKKTGKSILISYTDNGKGATIDDKKYGNGLHNVENRIAAIQGSFTFNSQLGEGFKAEIKFPN
ncbi:MAG: tetratricopeptide (TPR) repeat protein [Sediminicola sp.]|jgi:two-component sensor histidine kinase